jgi:cyclophilin family peptidyl-prolyl cis-trans isomerase
MNTLYRLIVLISIPLLLTACQSTKSSNESSNNKSTGEPTTMDTAAQPVRSFDKAPEKLPDDQVTNKEVILKTTKGEIKFTLLTDDAPLTVSNFVFLVSNHFYDGLTFHRVEPNFVIQGGDPKGNGTGGPGYKFADEPVKRSYSRGIVAMANSGPNTNGSQFFIMLKDTPLPPAYTVFGEVTSGMDVVDQIRVGDTMTTVEVQDKK